MQGNAEAYFYIRPELPHPAYQSATTTIPSLLSARIVLVLKGLRKWKQAPGSQRDENAAPSRITQAEINWMPAFGLKGMHVVDAVENLWTEDIDMCIC